MTDNEKRAHDLAICMIPVMCTNAAQIASERNQSEVHFDAYDTYKQLYSTALNSFNRDFPNGK